MATILPDLTQLSREELIAQINALKSQNSGRVTFKVSEKGCVSVYGLNIRGIHLYASQWLRILDHADAIRAFIEANRKSLAWKD